MKIIFNKFKIVFCVQLIFFIGTTSWSQSIDLKAVGNKGQGYTVDIYNDYQLLVHNSKDFKLKVAKLDLSECLKLLNGKVLNGKETRIM